MTKDRDSGEYGASVPGIEIVTSVTSSSDLENRGASVPGIEPVPKPSDSGQNQQGQSSSDKKG